LGVAEVDQQAVAEVLGDVPVIALDHLGAGVLIGPHHLPPLFRVEPAGECGRIYQVAEKHRELAAFGVWGAGSCGSDVWRERYGGLAARVWGDARPSGPDQHAVLLIA